MAVLSLLALRFNRAPGAWWIWVPLLIGTGAQVLLRQWMSSIESGAKFLVEVNCALIFGWAAAWLLAPKLPVRHRFITFLSLLLVVMVSSGLILMLREWDGEVVEVVAKLIVLEIGVVVSLLAFSLADLVCRRRYSFLRFSAWLTVFAVGATLLIAAPFFIINSIENGWRDSLWEFFGPVLFCACCYVAYILLYGFMAQCAGFYRERWKRLLHVEEPSWITVPPPGIPEPETVSKAYNCSLPIKQ